MAQGQLPRPCTCKPRPRPRPRLARALLRSSKRPLLYMSCTLCTASPPHLQAVWQRDLARWRRRRRGRRGKRPQCAPHAAQHAEAGCGLHLQVRRGGGWGWGAACNQQRGGRERAAGERGCSANGRERAGARGAHHCQRHEQRAKVHAGAPRHGCTRGTGGQRAPGFSSLGR